MDFFINKDSNYPELVMELVKGDHIDEEAFFNMLQNSDITFKMVDADTKMIKVGYKDGFCRPVNGNEFLIGYSFKDEDVDRTGTFIGQFIIKFKETNDRLIVPLQEELRIHIK